MKLKTREVMTILIHFRERERKEELLAAEESALEKEKLRLHEVSQRRMRMKELRQRKELE